MGILLPVHSDRYEIMMHPTMNHSRYVSGFVLYLLYLETSPSQCEESWVAPLLVIVVPSEI